jgi:hypothetical protein
MNMVMKITCTLQQMLLGCGTHGDMGSKGKVVPVLDKVPRHEDVWGSEGIASHILKHGSR